jgi:hypothetical protein
MSSMGPLILFCLSWCRTLAHATTALLHKLSSYGGRWHSRVSVPRGNVREEVTAQWIQHKLLGQWVIRGEHPQSRWIDVVPIVDSVCTRSKLLPVKEVLHSDEVDAPSEAVRLEVLLHVVSIEGVSCVVDHHVDCVVAHR